MSALPTPEDRHDPAMMQPLSKHTSPGRAASSPQPAIRTPEPIIRALAGVPDPGRPTEARGNPLPIDPALRLDDPTLNLAASFLDDIERVRIGAGHRVRILTAPNDKPDEDGVCRGQGVPSDHPVPATVTALSDQLLLVEKQAVKALEKAMKAHPLGPWVSSMPGVGLKMAARLLAAVGDPYWNARDDCPRTVSQLWAYCGLHTLPADRANRATHESSVGGDQAGSSDPGLTSPDTHGSGAWVAARRKKGVQANWSTSAKTRAYLIAEKSILFNGQADKNGRQRPLSPYRVKYDQRRSHTQVSHPEWTDGHAHNDALRVASKELLKDLWKAARDLHEGVAPAP